jgi:2,4-dienoyl-CoA reductase-like NADH-dependent reductase (Old Yellow Enzyme family)
MLANAGLFTPHTLKGMVLKNRIIKSAQHENMATNEGLPTDESRRFYERLAAGGAGLIITGITYVSESGQSFRLQNGIDKDKAITEWRKVTDAVHEHGGKIAMQIMHGGRQIKSRDLGGRKSLAPSAFPDLVWFTMPRPMTEAEILQTIRDFGDAAARVKQAGFDAVQIQGAQGFLASGFLSRLTNRRRDGWGGDFERRFRFLAELYLAVRRAVGPDFPVLYKLNIKDYVPFGITPRDSFPAARRLAELGVDAIQISAGIFETYIGSIRGESFADIISRGRSRLTSLYFKSVMGAEKLFMPFREAYFLPYAADLRQTLNIPLILAGGIRSPAFAEKIIESGKADFISMARPLVREPDLPNKWRKGDRQPAQCVSCNRCLGEVEQGNKLRCYYTKRKRGANPHFP